MTKYSKDSQKHRAITAKITNLLVVQMVATTIVDSDEWRELLKELDPRYECPSRKHFSNSAIPTKYSNTKEQIMKDLKEAGSISCTTDGWSSTTTDPYLSLTVHLFTPSWQLRTYCLRTIYLPESHTGDNIAKMLRTILTEYGLHISDVTSFTTDNGANMKCAIRKLEVVRIPCFGHILHNAINNATKDVVEVQDMLKSSRQLVSTLNHCFRLKNDLKKKQKEAGLPMKSLLGECKTRWGSKFEMVKRMFVNIKPVQSLLINERKYADQVPSYELTTTMEMFVKTLEPFHQLTDALSHEKTVSVCNIWPLLQHIKATCNTAIDTETELPVSLVNKSEQMRSDIWKYISERYEGESEGGAAVVRLLKLCTYLDPRFLSVEGVDVREDIIIEAVALEVDAHPENDVSENQSDGTQGSTSSMVVATPKVTAPKVTASLMDILIPMNTGATETENNDDAHTRAEKEVDYYNQIGLQMIQKDDDIGIWWKEKGKQFPMMQRVAKKYLTSNATSTASERLFSLAGNIATKKRNRLKPENVDMLSCLAYNLKKNPDLK